MEIASGLIKLKPNSEEKVDQWSKTVSSRIEEAVTTLRDEGVEIESWFRVEIGGQDYLLWYMRAESIEKALKTAKISKHPLDKFHYEIMGQIMETNGNILATPILNLTAKAES